MNQLTRAPRAILIDIIPPQLDKQTAERRLLELDALTKTYGGIVVVKLFQKRSTPDYRTYIGSGKLNEIIQLAAQEKAELLIINNLLKPKQLFEIEEWIRKSSPKQNRSALHVWDRVDLILKIFDKHAKTAEAKLQIKLAAIRHMGPRIFGMGLELMQQTGGIGTRGVGETNTEIMRRHLAEQERQVKRELERIAVSRANHRKHRDRIGLKTVSIIGYTNAGKSSLLNALTHKSAYVANVLFSTLDTRVDKLYIPHESSESERVTSEWGPQTRAVTSTHGVIPTTGPVHSQKILLSDTIGFIQDLPPQLIDAFRSTLDETIDADAVLQIVDASDPYLPQKLEEVEKILHDLRVDEKPRLFVFNKIDALSKKDAVSLKKKFRHLKPQFVSALTKQGIPELKKAIAKLI